MSRFQDWKGELLLGASFFIGLALIFISRWFSIQWDGGFIGQVGDALVIAPIIARGIELVMTRRIAQDVFKAAFGYSMPDHFKSEISRIADQRLICTMHRMHLHVELLDGDLVRVTTRIHREITNIGPHNVEWRGMNHIDEWGFSEPSKITACKIVCGGETIEVPSDQMQILTDSTIKAESPPLTLKRNETATTIVENTEIRRNNDHLMYGFLTPTENPIIHLDLPPTLEGYADAGIPGGKGGESKAIPHQYEFIGVYFPPAHMRVRWWPKVAN
jgi:hypothetical protein